MSVLGVEVPENFGNGLEFAEPISEIMKRYDPLDLRHGTPLHPISEVLTCLLIGSCAGRCTQKDALDYCKRHLDELKTVMSLPYGIASRATACRILQMINEEDFGSVFTEWATSIVSTQDTEIIVDGKGQRGSAKKNQGERTPYVLNGLEASTQLVVDVLEVGDKENEKVEFHPLLNDLDITGSFVYSDAMGTDQNIMRDIVDRKADFVLQVKGNNPSLHDQLIKNMDALIAESKKDGEKAKIFDNALESYSHHSTSEVNGGRKEYREAWVTNDVSLVTHSDETLPFLKTIGVMEQVRILQVKDKDGNDITPTKEEFMRNGSTRQENPTSGDGIDNEITKVGVVSSMVMDAEEIMRRRREYWKIENGFHYIVDDSFREDFYHYHVNRFIMAVIRRYAYNIIRIINIRLHPKESMRGTVFLFCDTWKYVVQYIFNGIQRFN